jgi:hypothetical protein
MTKLPLQDYNDIIQSFSIDILEMDIIAKSIPFHLRLM